MINICKWYNNANSPVMFMIDDLSNTWIDLNDNGNIEVEEDWGYGKDSINSSFSYLNNCLLNDFPDIKVTFFVPVGKRSDMIKYSKIKTISYPINNDVDSKAFFKMINSNDKFEIAYHGTTHGVCGETRRDFIQEWATYKNIYDANKIIKDGLEIYMDTFGEYPYGGKYCGYTSNEFSDKTISDNNFLWWCRYCNILTKDEYKKKNINRYIFGKDVNEKTNFDIKFFEENSVIDIPTTLSGNMLTGIYSKRSNSIKGIIKKCIPNVLVNIKLKKIKFLLKNKLVISIQEHMSPSRNDGVRQTPNIIDDHKSIKRILYYLKNKNVWYCTGTELASYVYYRENLNINNTDNYFEFTNLDNLRKLPFYKISIFIGKDKIIEAPNGEKIIAKNGFCTVSLQSGKYKYI